MLSFKYHMGGYFKASNLCSRGYRYIEVFEMAQILYRGPGAALPSLEGVITFITDCSTYSSIYSERRVSILTELIETYGEHNAACGGHGSSGNHCAWQRGVVGGLEFARAVEGSE